MANKGELLVTEEQLQVELGKIKEDMGEEVVTEKITIGDTSLDETTLLALLALLENNNT